MPDFRVADTAAEHAKMRAAGPAALGVWAMGGAYCMNPAHLTDGWVPLHYIQSWPNGKRLASRLVQVGLWFEETRMGMPGYQFHDWLDKQRSAESIEDEKAKAKARMTRIRSGNVRPNKQRTSERTSPERAANVHDSLTLTHTLTPGEELGGEVPEGDASVRERPSDRCFEHVNAEQPPPCRACGTARLAAESFDRDQIRANADRRSSDARERAELRAQAVAACHLCDDRGYVGPQLCTHDPNAAERASRGRAAVQAALAARSQPPPAEQRAAG
jgi:hypothetical protein